MSQSDLPFAVWWQEAMAEAHWRSLVRLGVIKPHKPKHAYRFLGGTWNQTKDGRANPVATRELNAVLTLTKKTGRGNKLARQLLYELAKWLGQRDVPKRSLKPYAGDQNLFDILKRHAQVSCSSLCWDDLSTDELRQLELRLYHQWGIAGELARLLNAPIGRMASNRKPTNKLVKRRIPVRLTGNPWGMALKNLAGK